MKHIRFFIVYVLPPIIWMGTIFWFSNRHHFTITESSVSDFFIFKLLHMAEYGGLYFWLFRLFYKTHKKDGYKYAFIISILYAISDEIHQSFIPTREPRMRDVVIDSTGIIIMFTFLKYFFFKIKRYIMI